MTAFGGQWQALAGLMVPAYALRGDFRQESEESDNGQNHHNEFSYTSKT
jgi:hypothetical protein